MGELAIAGGLVAVLAVFSIAGMLPFEQSMAFCNAVIALGALVGVPTGVWYHVLLYRALAPRGELPRGWIWAPIRLNDRVPEQLRGRVLFFCYAGAVGFGIIVLGVLAIVSALALTALRAR